MLRNPPTSVIVALLALGLVASAGAATQEEVIRSRMERMKAIQQRMLFEEPLHGREEKKERYEEAKKNFKKRQAAAKKNAETAAKSQKAGARMKPIEGERLEQLREATRTERERKATLQANQNSASALGVNRPVSNPVGDLTGNAGQSEVSIAVDGNHVIAAWNDGDGYNYPLANPKSSTQGFGWSNDGGITWKDGGIPPATGVGHWASDPVVTVNEKTHKFYFGALCDPSSVLNGVAVVEGSFVGAQDTLQWGTPSVARSISNNQVLLDKEWIAADSSTNRLYLVYARFVLQFGQITTNAIDFQVATTPGAANWTWSSATQLSAGSDGGYVQGARVAVGPAGEVYTTWMAIGQLSNSYWGRDYLRMKKSTNGGASFGAQTTPDSLFANWGSGCPGFNRSTGVTFPGMAVDRTTGPNRGRVYLTWNESINFYYDNLGYQTPRTESEPNGNAAGADQFTVGDSLAGSITSGDVDYWRFNGTAGQTVIFFATNVDPALDLSTEMVCTDGTTSLAYSENGFGGATLIVFTPPTTGVYYMRLQAAEFSGSTGVYEIVTGPHTPLAGGGADRARDHRDIFVKSSTNGTTWAGAPSLVSVEPGRFDDYLPEIQVGGDGKPYVAWHAFHDAPAGVCLGSGANIYLARSDDGGGSWTPGSPVTDVTTVWNGDINFSNIQPNLGDYMGLFANNLGVYVGWADGRNGSPDVYMATVPLGYTAVAVSLVSTRATPEQVDLVWMASEPVAATVERRQGEGAWMQVGQISADGSGRLSWQDRDVTAGSHYDYRLAVASEGTTRYFGDTSVDVPSNLAFALHGAQPNPSPGLFKVAFTLPDAASAQLELVDIAGRRVAEQQVGVLGAGHHVVDLTGGRNMPAGVYLVRLNRAGATLTTRVSVVR